MTNRLIASVLTAGVVAGCHQEPSVKCGDGTVLRDGVCEVVLARPPPAPAASPIVAQVDAAVPPIDAHTASWTYDDLIIDKMRNIKAHIARVQSDPSDTAGRISLEPKQIALVIRRAEGKGDEVMILTDSIVDCGLGSHVCMAHAKLDAAPVESALGEELTGDHGFILMKSADWVSRFRTAHQFMIEISFIGGSTRQFSLDVSGLDWPELPKAPSLPNGPTSPFYCYTKTGVPDDVRDSYCARTFAKCERERATYGAGVSEPCAPHKSARCVSDDDGEECMLTDHDCALMAATERTCVTR